MKLQNRVALITGGTSGIGAAMAREFAREGARVAIVGRNEARGNELAREVRGKFYAVDIASADAPLSLTQSVLDTFGRLDILVNNAGIIYRKTVEEKTLAEWDETLAVNLTAPFLFSQAALPALRASGRGVILNVASGAGLFASRRMAAYAASKGALVQLTRAMALDHARENIRVIALCPADVDTPMVADEARQFGQTHAERLAQLKEVYPLGRIGTPGEIARAAVFLASDDCTFITGTTLLIDGGLRAG